MQAIDVYQMFRALQLHFKSTNYDYVKYNGKVKIDSSKFETRKDRFHYEKIRRKFQGKSDDIQQFLVANLSQDPNTWIGNLLTEDSMKKYKQWKSYHESLSYNFETEMGALAEALPKKMSANQMLIPINGEHPWLLQKFYEGMISPTSLIVMQSVLNFVPMWNKKIDDDILWPETRERLSKLAPFINANLEKAKKVLVKSFKSAI